jgi:hypothetical protein
MDYKYFGKRFRISTLSTRVKTLISQPYKIETRGTD